MDNKDLGEHSRKTRNDNGDGNDEDRPFKKAKYVWQLKGKYHLKESYQQSNNSDPKEGCSKDTVEEIKANEDIAMNNNNSNNKSCNKCCLDTLLARSNALLESEDSNDVEVNSNDTDRSTKDEIPVTLVVPYPKNQDDYLSKWQARQVAKCYVDNTINSILEQYHLAPLDAADFVENCDNDGQIEDEGILMAIQSHGLRNSGITFNDPSEDECLPTKLYRTAYLQETALYRSYYKTAENAEQEMLCDSDTEKGEMTDQMDFLSTAVSVAIKKKGLSSYSYG